VQIELQPAPSPESGPWISAQLVGSTLTELKRREMCGMIRSAFPQTDFNHADSTRTPVQVQRFEH
jgi:hypothetical protein